MNNPSQLGSDKTEPMAQFVGNLFVYRCANQRAVRRFFCHQIFELSRRAYEIVLSPVDVSSHDLIEFALDNIELVPDGIADDASPALRVVVVNIIQLFGGVAGRGIARHTRFEMDLDVVYRDLEPLEQPGLDIVSSAVEQSAFGPVAQPALGTRNAPFSPLDAALIATVTMGRKEIGPILHQVRKGLLRS